jgi:hypothetical protein
MGEENHTDRGEKEGGKERRKRERERERKRAVCTWYMGKKTSLSSICKLH